MHLRKEDAPAPRKQWMGMDEEGGRRKEKEEILSARRAWIERSGAILERQVNASMEVGSRNRLLTAV